MSALQFTGSVTFRSSLSNAAGPPGEAAILSLNPQRSVSICALTGWSRLEPGSLNLSVQHDVVERLKLLKPTWEEDGLSVVYPPEYGHIPIKRGSYLYYLAGARAFHKQQEVLVRTARNGIIGRVELFASINLRSYFAVAANDAITLNMHAD